MASKLKMYLAGFVALIIFGVLAAIAFNPDWVEADALQKNSLLNTDSPDVKIMSSLRGHGSGVYIGNNVVLTASHVIENRAADYTVKTHSGRVYKSRILWSHDGMDLAALHIEADDIEGADLSCDTPPNGSTVKVRGHPYDLGFVETTSRVVGQPRNFQTLEGVYLVDGLLGPGMSGGAVYHAGKVVGLTIAMHTEVAQGFIRVPTGFRFIASPENICMLLGRGSGKIR